MPRVDGFEFLERKADAAGFADIPVAILSSSDADYLKNKTISLGATCFMTKPVTVGELSEKIRQTLHFVFPGHPDFQQALG